MKSTFKACISSVKKKGIKSIVGSRDYSCNNGRLVNPRNRCILGPLFQIQYRLPT